MHHHLPHFSFLLFAIVSDRSFLFFFPPGLNHKTWVEYIIIILSSASCQRIFGSSSLAARVFHRTMTGRRWMKFSFFFKTYYIPHRLTPLLFFILLYHRIMLICCFFFFFFFFFFFVFLSPLSDWIVERGSWPMCCVLFWSFCWPASRGLAF